MQGICVARERRERKHYEFGRLGTETEGTIGHCTFKHERGNDIMHGSVLATTYTGAALFSGPPGTIYEGQALRWDRHQKVKTLTIQTEVSGICVSPRHSCIYRGILATDLSFSLEKVELKSLCPTLCHQSAPPHSAVAAGCFEVFFFHFACRLSITCRSKILGGSICNYFLESSFILIPTDSPRLMHNDSQGAADDQ